MEGDAGWPGAAEAAAVLAVAGAHWPGSEGRRPRGRSPVSALPGPLRAVTSPQHTMRRGAGLRLLSLRLLIPSAPCDFPLSGDPPGSLATPPPPAPYACPHTQQVPLLAIQAS